MNGRITTLSALLALQLVVIAALLAGVGVGGGVGGGGGAGGPVLTFEPSAVDTVRISGEGNAVALRRQGDGWILGNGQPADDARVRDTLERLAALRGAWPVATSADAGERFEVAPETHRRHLVLGAGDETVAELYLGTSPGYQQVHARPAGDTAIYSVELANYQLPADPDVWLDATLLRPRGTITRVSRNGAWQLERDEAGWLLGEAAAAQDAARGLVGHLKELRVNGMADEPADGAAPVAQFDIADAEGTLTLSLYQDDSEEGAYRVASNRRDGHFSLARHAAEALLLAREDLEPPTGTDTAAESADETAEAAAAEAS
ncbi:MAG: DUF4340 domain-containing protein [Pseudomonadota bacterium]